jgi:hypothetical protein
MNQYLVYIQLTTMVECDTYTGWEPATLSDSQPVLGCWHMVLKVLIFSVGCMKRY